MWNYSTYGECNVRSGYKVAMKNNTDTEASNMGKTEAWWCKSGLHEDILHAIWRFPAVTKYWKIAGLWSSIKSCSVSNPVEFMSNFKQDRRNFKRLPPPRQDTIKINTDACTKVDEEGCSTAATQLFKAVKTTSSWRRASGHQAQVVDLVTDNWRGCFDYDPIICDIKLLLSNPRLSNPCVARTVLLADLPYSIVNLEQVDLKLDLRRRPVEWESTSRRAEEFAWFRSTLCREEERTRANKRGYAWAISAGLNAALAAISAKLFTSEIIRYGLVLLFNLTMWVSYVNSLRSLSSLQATVTNFATNFLTSGLAGYFLFEEPLSIQWFSGALLIVVGVLILSKTSIHNNKALKTE
ncbi:hypothetical protein F8388_024026 [Cannabis sativa]|uniref:EamA domain-containing protein n=1 Tax=Cannabis sativa TaxID=3483 RepID=A0A7J6FXS7_CANSA|nr:hypothetical protein G4B88_022001 [Cannabis sativa]KAF4375367.1 hypothetical protein F8388_024026 [Cannabis sativa]